MDPFKPTVNKPGTLGWWKEIFVRWLGFIKQGAKEVVNAARGRR